VSSVALLEVNSSSLDLSPALGVCPQVRTDSEGVQNNEASLRGNTGGVSARLRRQRRQRRQELVDFEGATWNVTLTTTISCAGQAPQSGSTSTTVAYSAGSGADLQYTSRDGCLFKFNVSGNAANLSNAPVSCSTTINGTAYVITFNSYTASTSDGHNLTINAAGNIASGGTTCPIALTGSGTR
jgi:hypothetical protein